MNIELNSNYVIYDLGGGWGNSINFLGWRSGKSVQPIYGHMTPKPRNGDVLRAKMDSGRIGLFVISEMYPAGDPPDMFFAKASFVGYEDEFPLPEAAL